MDCEVKILEELFHAKKVNDNIINPRYMNKIWYKYP